MHAEDHDGQAHRAAAYYLRARRPDSVAIPAAVTATGSDAMTATIRTEFDRLTVDDHVGG